MTTENGYQGTHSTAKSPNDETADSGSEGDKMKAIKDGAQDVLDGAKDMARSKLSDSKEGAASGIDEVASALRDVGKGADEGAGSDMLIKLAGSAADGLERLSTGIRNKDAGTMLRDVQSFAREQPAAFFGLTVAAGFLAARFLKASQAPSGTERSGTTGAAPHSGQQHTGKSRQEETWANR